MAKGVKQVKEQMMENHNHVLHVREIAVQEWNETGKGATEQIVEFAQMGFLRYSRSRWRPVVIVFFLPVKTKHVSSHNALQNTPPTLVSLYIVYVYLFLVKGMLAVGGSRSLIH